MEDSYKSVLWDSLSFERNLGCGSFGTVYAGRYHVGGPPVAIKVLHLKDNIPAFLQFCSEIQIHFSLEHPNIVSMKGFCVDGGNPAIVMELMACSLFSLLFYNKKSSDPCGIKN